jgi:hypothetical protein
MIEKIIKNINKIKIGIVFYYKLYRNAKILSFNKKKKISKKNKILIATSSGGLYTHLILESALACGLRNQEAEVHFLLCKKGLSSCIMPDTHTIDEIDYINEGPKKFCKSCFNVGSNYLTKSGFELRFIENASNDDSKKYLKIIEKELKFENVKDFTYKGIKIGEHAISGTLRYYKKTDYEKEKYYKELIKKYLFSCMVTVDHFNKLLEKEKYDTIVLNHGIYVPHGVIADIAKKKKVHFVVWCSGVRKQTFSFSPNDTYHRETIYEDNKNWENILMNEKKKKLISDYLESKFNSNSKSIVKDDWKNEWVYSPSSSIGNIDKLFEDLNIDRNKPLIGLATNVIWDAQIDFPSNFFNHILEWIFFTIDYFVKNQHLQLIIRVHPAEVAVQKPSKQKVVNEIFKKYGTLPNNIFIVKPEENYNTYKILDKCDNILIYGSRVGVEMAALGKTVIVAGEGFIRGKNIALDINSIEEYKRILSKLPIKDHMNEIKIMRAKKYAYHFFFRRMIPIKVIDEVQLGWPNFQVNKNFSKLLNDRNDKGFEKICNSIINHKKFIFDEVE